MITGCPSCATRDTLPATHADGETCVRICRTCGHEWREANGLQVIDVRAESTALVPIDHGRDVDREVRRLAEVARLAAALPRTPKRMRCPRAYVPISRTMWM